MNRFISRRKFLLLGGAGVAGALSTARLAEAIYDGRAAGSAPRGLSGVPATGSSPSRPRKILALAGTDGWASMPVGADPMPPYYPDVAAPENTDTYIFGFRDVSGLSQDVLSGQKNKVQISAPLIDVNADEELWLTLANLGLQQRPDLVDSHTLHWHGFRNAIPFYDGVPETSISVPIGRQFTYVFRPDDPGTYMYHCHFEDVEHVTMGMTGIVFVRPNRTKYPAAAKNAARNNMVRLVYDDPAVKAGGPVTNSPYFFNREYSIILTEIDSRAHFQDAHILATDWTDFRANFWLMNGRAYPDTLEPNAPVDTTAGLNFGKPAREADGTLRAPLVSRDGNGHYTGPALPHLKNQPQSSLIVAAPGERVLLRLVNLGFGEQSLTLPGIEMTTVGSDARPLNADTQTKSDIVTLGPGESHDVIITAPAAGEYALFNRDMGRYAGIAGDSWFGGQRTSVIVKSGIGPQLYDNHWDPAWL